MSQRKTVGRRTFLVGLATGAGAVAAVNAAPRKGTKRAEAGAKPASGPILYRRTAEAERYYRTLYS